MRDPLPGGTVILPSKAKEGQSANAPAVPFNRPAFIGTELDEIYNAIVENRQISGVGPYSEFCENFLSDYYGRPVLLVSSCTHALEMAAQLLDLNPGDEVIVPSYTFVSSANAYARQGCHIRFAECDRFGQISLESIEKLTTEKTRAICVVHYAGNSTDMIKLSRFCQERNIALIEDAAQAITATFQDQLLGTFGDLATFSFHETKNITSGEGGALVVNNENLLDRAYNLREKGTNRRQFFQGLVDKYTWVDKGSNFSMSDLNAAYLSVQLKHLDEIHQRRRMIFNRYEEKLLSLTEQLDVEILPQPVWNITNHHMFAMIFTDPQRRKDFIAHMKSQSIVAPFHYVALHQSPMGQELGLPSNEDFTQTERFSNGLVRLPLFYNMTSWQQEKVIEAIQGFIKAHPR